MTSGPDPSDSGALYRTLVEQISAITYVDTLVEGSAVPLYVSPQVGSLLGIPQHVWLSDPKAWQRFVHPDDVEEAVARFTAGFAAGGSFSLVYRMVHPDGRIVWIDERAAVLPTEDDHPGLLHGVMIDVTDAREAEAELRRVASLLSATLDSTADGVLVVDAGGAITTYNRRFVEMWGIPKDILDRHEDEAALRYAEAQLTDPQRFLAKVRELYAQPGHESFDELEFVDGRVFERYSIPQRIGDEVVGRVWSFRDVSEQRRTEREYRSLVDRLPAIVYVAEPGVAAPWRYVSPRSQEILGFSPEQWTADPELWYRQIHPEDRDRVMREETTATERLGSLVSEYRMLSADGRTVWIRDEGEFLADPAGGPGLLRGLMHDVTSERLAADQLRSERERLGAVVEHIPVMLVFFDADGEVALINREAETTLGWSLEEMRTMDILAELYPDPDYRREVERTIAAQRSGELAGTWREFRIRTRDGRNLVTEWFDLGFADGAHLRIGRDVTKHRVAEEERRLLLEHIVTAQEEERSRIAEDIHDDSIQSMAAVGIRLTTLAQHIDDEAARAALERVEASVASAIARLRHLMFQLRPRVLDEEGLVPTLELVLGQMAEDEGLVYRLEDRLAEEPPLDSRAILYRIVQEALANIRKHTRGASVEVAVGGRDGGYFVRVRDDGEGFDARAVTASPAGHMGLSSMRERAEMAGGWLRIESAPGRGTTVESWIPALRPPAPGQRPA